MAGYGDDNALKAYWTAAGYTYANDAPFAALRQRGSVYVDGTFGMRFPGVPTGGASQERAWPRTGAADVYGNPIDPETVPLRVVDASYEAAYIELKRPGSLGATVNPAKRIKRQKVDTIEREFFEAGSSDSIFAPNAPVSSIIEGILAPLIGPAAGWPSAMVV